MEVGLLRMFSLSLLLPLLCMALLLLLEEEEEEEEVEHVPGVARVSRVYTLNPLVFFGMRADFFVKTVLNSVAVASTNCSTVCSAKEHVMGKETL